jgi:tetratricopeptide (TPR) repeat protein
MAKRYFNWSLAIVLMVAVVVFAAAVFVLHRWQKSTRADQALPLGNEAYAQQNWDQAATQLGRYLAVNGGDVDALLKYAEAQLNRRPVTQNNVLQAVAAYRSVLRFQPGNGAAARRLLDVYLSMNTPGEAELVARRYLEERDDPVIRRLLAGALMRQRKGAEAAAELTRIIAKDPTQVQAYELLKDLAVQRPADVNKPPAFWLEEAIARNPEAALAYVVRAHYRLQTNERTQALADLEQAEKLDLSDTDVRLRLARELLNAGALDKAREHLAALQAQKPDDQTLWSTYAELAFRSGSPEEMYTVAQTGLKNLAAQPWDFMPVAAELCIRSEHFEEAQDYLSQLRRKDILPATVAFLEGLLADKQGRLREAIASWQKAISLEETKRLADRSATPRLLLSSALARSGDLQSAIGQLRVLVSEHPDHFEGHLMLTRFLVRLRDWPEAMDEARRAQQISPNQAEAILLELQARMHMLAAAEAPAGQEKDWQGIDERLAVLDRASKGALPIKLLQVQAAMLQHKFPEAESLLRELEAAHPSELNVVLLQADLYAAQDKEQEAIARYRSAMEKFPQSADPVRGLVFFLERRNRSQECESLVKEALARVEEPGVRRELGQLLAELYRQSGPPEKLYQWLTEMARQFPEDIQPKRQLLTCSQVMQDRGQAQALVDQIKALEGDKGWQWRYEQARLWFATVKDANDFRRNYYPRVVKLLQENLLANPDEQASRLLLAATYERAGEMTLALSTYREALARAPDNIQVLVRAVAALNKAGEDAEAQDILDKAAQRGLYHPDLQKLQLQGHLRRGDLTSASDILQDFIHQDPNDTSSRLSLALVFMQQGKFEEARAILDDLKAKTPGSLSVAGAEIRLDVLRGDAQEAIRRCDEVIQSQGNAVAYLLRARTYVALKDNVKAREDFGRAITAEPKRAELWAARADFYLSLGRMEEAILDIRQALALAPQSLPVQKRAIILFLASAEPSLVREAEVMTDKALTVSSDDLQLQLFKARILALKGTGPAIEQARRMLREITDTRPKYADAWEWMTRLELQQGEPGKAVDIALRGLAHSPADRQLLLLKAKAEKEHSPMLAALTLKGLTDQYPQDVEVLIELADAYVKDGRPEQAIELLRQRRTGFEGAARRRCEMALAVTLYRSGQRDDAKLLFNTLVQAEPADPAPVMALAQLLGKEKRWPELNQVISQWRDTHPDDIATTTSVASALAGTGEKEAMQMAEDLLRMALERNPKSLPNLMLLGMLMQSAGRDEEAAALNRRILDTDPNNIVALNNLAWILCEDQQRCEEALQLADKGLTIAPDYLDLIDTRGVVYYRSGSLEKAAADFAKCIELYPTNSRTAVVPRFHLARVYAKMGRRTQAIQQLQEVLSMQERIGGLAPQDLAEAKTLLDELQKGS